MFKLIPSDRPGFLSAQISEDNMIISWDPSLSKTGEPPWTDLYMKEYHDIFMEALRDYRILQRVPQGIPRGIPLQKTLPIQNDKSY